MKKFIGRKEELKKLKNEIEKENRSFISIVGRRGIGKSTLIQYFLQKEKELINDFMVLQIEGKKGKPLKEQVKDVFNYFSRKFSFTKEDVKFFNKNQNWNSLFEILNEYTKDKKIILVIDEFAWFQTKGSYFIEEFGAFYNKNIFSNLKIIISASAISWMNKNVIKNKGSLYHKVSLSIKLKPFSLLETVEFLKENNFNLHGSNVLKYYAITGGVVRYLEKANPLKTFEENAVEIFKCDTNISGLEFDEIFQQTFSSNSDAHQKIINSFDKKKSLTIKEIKKETGLSITTINEILEELVVSDILSERNNYKNKKKDKIYFLTDLFCLSFIKLAKNQILDKSVFSNHRFSINMGFLFEIIAMLNVDLIKKSIGRNGIKSIEYAWFNKEAQIDLIIEYENKKYSIIECKLYNEVFKIDLEYQKNLINKKNSFIKFLKSKKINNPEIDFIIYSLYGSKIPKEIGQEIGFIYYDVSFEEMI